MQLQAQQAIAKGDADLTAGRMSRTFLSTFVFATAMHEVTKAQAARTQGVGEM